MIFGLSRGLILRTVLSHQPGSRSGPTRPRPSRSRSAPGAAQPTARSPRTSASAERPGGAGTTAPAPGASAATPASRDDDLAAGPSSVETPAPTAPAPAEVAAARDASDGASAHGAAEVETPEPPGDAQAPEPARGTRGSSEVETPAPLADTAAREPIDAAGGTSEVETPAPIAAPPHFPEPEESMAPDTKAPTIARRGGKPKPVAKAREVTPSAVDPARATLQELAETRLAIEGVEPEIDAGRFAAKCVAGRPMRIEADAFSDGHEVIRAALHWRARGEARWHEAEMAQIVNDRWGCELTVPTPGYYEYTFLAWRDLYGTWHRDTAKKIAAGQDVPVEHEEGRLLVKAAIEASPDDRAALKALQSLLAEAQGSIDPLMAPEAVALLRRAEPRANLSTFPRVLPLFADREAAAFSAWYEMMPRSQGEGGRHGTFRDVIGKLDYVRDLGFDVLYFTPIHPIGKTNRKGKNNSLKAEPGDVGSPYAIGSSEGGFTSVHPELGTLEDFDALVSAAREKGIELAMDIALNASPDHPWIAEHPDWFERRPDGTIKYAENPPKKYEDIVNFRYYLADGKPNAPFWEAIRDVILFWTSHGVLMFRVDNPHTKPFPFWEWIIREVRQEHPGAVFLSEAFTRPKLMKRLAKVGYSQSYSYFTWRNTKAELTEYLTELTTEECRHVMRPNFFVNTPDINPYFLQSSGSVRASARGWSWRARWRAPTACTTASRSARRPRCPARRSISTPRSTRSANGTSTSPATSRTTSASSTACARSGRRCGSSLRCGSTTPCTTRCSTTASGTSGPRTTCCSRC